MFTEDANTYTQTSHVATQFGFLPNLNWNSQGTQVLATDGMLRILDTITNTVQSDPTPVNVERSLQWVDDQTFVTSNFIQPNLLKVWNARIGKLERTITTPLQEVSAIAVRPDNKTVLAHQSSGTVILVKIVSGRTILQAKLPFDDLGAMTWINAQEVKVQTNSGMWLNLKIGDTITATPTSDPEWQYGFLSAYDPAQPNIATADVNGTIRIWNFIHRRWEVNLAMAGNNARLLSIAWSADGRYLAASNALGYVQVWRTDNWLQIALLKDNVDAVTAVDWSKTGSLLATTGNDSRINVYEVVLTP